MLQDLKMILVFAGSAKILHIAPAPKHGNSISPSFPLEDDLPPQSRFLWVDWI